MARLVTYECDECGCEVTVKEMPETQLRPIYCCGMEVEEISAAKKKAVKTTKRQLKRRLQRRKRRFQRKRRDNANSRCAQPVILMTLRYAHHAKGMTKRISWAKPVLPLIIWETADSNASAVKFFSFVKTGKEAKHNANV